EAAPEGHGGASGAAVEGHAAAGGHHDPTEYLLMVASVAWALLGILVAFICYLLKPEFPAKVAAKLRAIHEILLNKYYVDEIYYGVFVDGCVGIANFFWSVVDVGIIDGLVNGTGRAVRATGEGLRKIQTGRTQAYAAAIVLGAVVLVAYFAIAAAYPG
ncbi:MAG: NADH-quinone oxidoreductase subunit L, partial [Deltaproteobacteria bacterium]|nr:NADH-quinone oxidoreductase subunit L [Deltaproteobacteria bacterium]